MTSGLHPAAQLAQVLPLPLASPCRYPGERGPGPCVGDACRHWIEDADERCVLEVVAVMGGLSQDQIAPLLGITHARVGQIEANAMRKVALRLRVIRGGAI